MNPSGVAVVTDSTSSLIAADVAVLGIDVVALRLLVGDRAGREGGELGAAAVSRALLAKVQVSTSRPTPEDFCAAYERAFDDGAQRVVSVHLSSALSGTYHAARLAAARFDGKVFVIDSRTTAKVLGFAVLRAGAVAAAGADVTAVATAVNDTVSRSTLLFYVDSLEWLRRGGRISPTAARVGTALSFRPLLHLRDGDIVVKERVRTTSRAIARLVELAVGAMGTGAGDIAVQHLSSAERAAEVATLIRERVGEDVAVQVGEVSAAVGAHVGPGLLGVAVCPR